MTPAAAAADESTTVLRMTVAPQAVTDSKGNVWQARSGFSGGANNGDYSASYDAGTQIKGTSEHSLYRHELVRMDSFKRALPNGTYDVTLKMREGWWTAAGQRVFNVTAEGKGALSNVDIFASVGQQAAYDRTFRVTVADGTLDLGFNASKDSALVSAIQIDRVAAPAEQESSQVVTRMSVNPNATKDAAGNTYSARFGFDRGDFAASYSGNERVAGTSDQELYRSELVRFNSWSQPVANGTYDVTLKMREAWWTAAGQRVFDVVAEGQTVLRDVDIFKDAGKGRAYDRSFRVEVKDGRLNLAVNNKKDSALVSALVVAKVTNPASNNPNPTPTSTPTSNPTTPAPTPTTPTPTPTATPTNTPTPPTSSTNRPSGLLFDSGVFPMHRAGVATAFENSRGKKLDVITVFPSRDNWGSMMGAWFLDNQRIPADFKGTLDVGVPLWPNDGNLNTAAAGGYNAQWEQFGRLVAAKYPNAYIRLGWEMNLPGWRHAAYARSAEQWKTAYRHAVNSIRKGGSNLRIAWVVNEGPGQTDTQDARVFYPGDAHVDYIGMDAYDWWPGYTSPANIAKHLDSQYGWNFWLDFAKSRGKKFVLPEWGVAPANSASGGDNPMYINFVYDWLKTNAQWIGYESYFSESDSYIRGDLFTNNQRASAEYKRWMGQLSAK
ncbi:hypothetical protein BJY21_004080 [Kineosphaera limosa]|nr:malectin domain-containing carbohydrate-binding protein [Kineosphaera limosa]NYE02896.1 hypothetical protein [Kineosphaera limosa]